MCELGCGFSELPEPLGHYHVLSYSALLWTCGQTSCSWEGGTCPAGTVYDKVRRNLYHWSFQASVGLSAKTGPISRKLWGIPLPFLAQIRCLVEEKNIPRFFPKTNPRDIVDITIGKKMRPENEWEAEPSNPWKERVRLRFTMNGEDILTPQAQAFLLVSWAQQQASLAESLLCTWGPQPAIRTLPFYCLLNSGSKMG